MKNSQSHLVVSYKWIPGGGGRGQVFANQSVALTVTLFCAYSHLIGRRCIFVGLKHRDGEAGTSSWFHSKARRTSLRASQAATQRPSEPPVCFLPWPTFLTASPRGSGLCFDLTEELRLQDGRTDADLRDVQVPLSCSQDLGQSTGGRISCGHVTEITDGPLSR